MEIKLKNQHLQESIDKFCGGNFSKALKNVFLPPEELPTVITVEFDAPKGIKCSITIPSPEVEIKKSYNPRRWNTYPEITPPSRDWMRVEAYNEDYSDRFRYVAQWRPCKDRDEYAWFDLSGKEIFVDRYRPWVGEDEDEEYA